MNVPKLSAKTIALLANGDAEPLKLQKPILQIIGLKKLPGNVQDRYRVMLSDGVNSLTNVMLNTQLSKQVNNEVLVLKKGTEVGMRIGDPALLKYTGSDSATSDDQSKLTASSSNESFGASTSEKPTSSKYAASNAQSASAPSTSRSREKVSAPKDDDLTVRSKKQQTLPIAQLSPFQAKWTILARVTAKSAIRDWSNQRGSGSLFSCTFVDASGEIRATAFNKEVDAFYSQLEDGKLYYISRGSLKPANKRFTSAAHNYELTLNSNTQIAQADQAQVADKACIPVIKFNWVKLSELPTRAIDSLVDVIGVVHSHQPVQQVIARTTGKATNKRELQLVDESNSLISVTLWSKDADDFEQLAENDNGHPVLALKGVRLAEYLRRLQLGVLPSSQMLYNPAGVDRVPELRRWYRDNRSADFVALSTGPQAADSASSLAELTPETVRNPQSHWRLLKNLTANEGDSYFFTKALVETAFKKDCVYRACVTKGCQKKLVEERSGQLRCDKCQKISDQFTYRILLPAQIADASGSANVVFFDETAQKLLGQTANELVELRNSNADAFDQLFMDLHGKEYIFKLRAKMEYHSDDQRMRLACMALIPLRESDYIVHMMNDIKKWSKKK